MTRAFEQQLAAIISEYDAARSQTKQRYAGDVLDDTQVVELRTRCIAAIERASSPASAYRLQVEESRNSDAHDWVRLAREVGIARALLSDVRNGYLKSVEELLHGEIFGDYLEMAAHLLDNGYKDAAAVVTGSTLEVHIRKMCEKHNINVEHDGRTKKADQLNGELSKQGVYSKLDQKNVTAWLGLRNDAAHGNYSAYTKDQVSLLLQSIQDFITRHPA